MMNKSFKCPFCGCSSFKIENGYYLCQICGKQTPMEENEPKKEKKPKIRKQLEYDANKIPLTIYIFLVIITIIPLIQDMIYLKHYKDIIKVIFAFDLLCVLILIFFAIITVMAIKGKYVSFELKNNLFIAYFFSVLLSGIIELVITVNYIDTFINLFYGFTYSTLIYATIYDFEHWINK